MDLINAKVAVQIPVKSSQVPEVGVAAASYLLLPVALISIPFAVD